MSYSRQSFGGRPPHPNYPNPPRGGGPAYNQQPRFLGYPTNFGPPNNAGTGDPRRYHPTRNNNGGRWDDDHPGQRRGPRPNMGQENYRPGYNNYQNGPAANQSYQRMPRPNQNQSQGYPQGRNQAGYQPYRRPDEIQNQRQPFHRQGYDSNQQPRRVFEDHNQQHQTKRRGGRNRRNNPNRLNPSEISLSSVTPSTLTPSSLTSSSGSIDDILIMPRTPENQPRPLVPSCAVPQSSVDRDGDVEMTEAPPMDSEIIRLLTEGTIALHEVTRIMLGYVNYHG